MQIFVLYQFFHNYLYISTASNNDLGDEVNAEQINNNYNRNGIIGNIQEQNNVFFSMRKWDKESRKEV